MNATQILVVDDTPHLRLLTSKFLSKAGFEVIEASDGVEALRALQINSSIELIFLDFMMPKMSGLEFLAKIVDFKAEQKIKICMMTSKEGLEDLTICLRSGADDYIVKPVDELILVDKAKILLSRKDVDEFCSTEFNVKGALGLPEGEIKIQISDLSENSMRFSSDLLLPIGAKVFVSAPEIQSLLGRSKPFLLRIYYSEKVGNIFKNRGTFIGLKDLEYKRLRAVTTKGG